ncbi:MAG: purine-nucleoside phosphorylase [Bdellovibrionales bacterium GWA2_49_15]|nr:MAG: purine-nucleoside phosphorylase [Bdellovibrionales bacterium GWA2_49_15]
MQKKKKPLILVSACLAGVPCRYDGEARERSEVLQLLREGLALPVCPEQLGGLPTPRAAAEISDKQVLTQKGQNLTESYRAGADAALALALKAGVSEAWLKSKSPMCGCGKIYNGSHTGTLIEGDGVFTQRLKQAGMRIKEID